MNINTFENTLSQLSSKGREVLKSIEDYKFTVEQTTRLLANDQHLAQKIIQKKKILDQAAGLIYSVVFDIENIDITQEYNDQAQEVENGPENLPQNSEESIPENQTEKTPDENIEEKPTEEKPEEEESEEKPVDKREKNPEKNVKDKSKGNEGEEVED